MPDDIAVRREALRFVRAVRDDPYLHEQVVALGPTAALDAVVLLAARAGFAITVAALRLAYADDWTLRRVRYLSHPADSAASTVAVVNNASSST